MSGKDSELAVDDSGVGQTQGAGLQLAQPGGGQQAVVLQQPAETDERVINLDATPPEQKSLMAAIGRQLDKGFRKQEATLSELKTFTTSGFNDLNQSISRMDKRFEKVESKVSRIDDDQTKLMRILQNTRADVKQNTVRLTELESDKIATKSNFDSMQKQIDELSEKMISITDVMEQLRSGKLGVFTDLEAPTLKDQYDMKVAFMKRKHGIGFFPIYKEHLDALMASNNCSEADSYRVAVSQFLQLEMSFEEVFVVNLEEHYVEIQYNMIDTVYVVFDDLDLSGARRIWQESKQLRKRQTGDADRDPRLINLDLPQFRDRLAAMKKYASHLRWEWNRANPDAYDAGERCMTRVVEAKEGGEDIYDFIVQTKLPGEEFDRVEWPANRSLPKIQWKNKEYKHHREFILKVKRDQQVRREDPPGRPAVTRDPTQSNGFVRSFTPRVHTYKPQHQYIPGVVDPGEGPSMSLNQAGGITDWMSQQLQQQRREMEGQQTEGQQSEGQQTPPDDAANQQNQPEQEPPAETFTEMAERLERDKKAKEQQRLKEEYDKEVERQKEIERLEKERREQTEKENRERQERFRKHVEERSQKEKRSVEEILKEMEEEERAKAEEIARQDKERAEQLRAIGGVSFNIGGAVEFQSSSFMEEPDLESKSEKELEKEMLALRKKKEKEELERWKKDEEARLAKEEEDRLAKAMIEEDLRRNKIDIDTAKKRREEIELRNNPGRNIITDVDNIDLNRNQDNYNVVTPEPKTDVGTKPKTRRVVKAKRSTEAKGEKSKSESEVNEEGWQEMTKEEEEDAARAAGDITLGIPASQMSELTFTPSSDAETILARAPLVARTLPRTEPRQPSITSFMLRRSSTLSSSQIATDDESEAEVFGTPTSGGLSTPPGSPNTTMPLPGNTASPNTTMPLPENTASPNLHSVSKSLQFKDDNYHIVPITPAGSDREVKVLTRKDMGKTQRSKLPLPKNQQTIEQQRRREILKKRWGSNQKLDATQPKSTSVSQSKPVKRAKEDSGEKRKDKINRIKSPEGAGNARSDSEASSEATSEAEGESTKEAKEVNKEDPPKEEDITASSDDLSSLSVLCTGEVNVTESDVKETEETTDEGEDEENLEATVIINEAGGGSQRADSLTPLGDEPPREEVEAGPAKPVIIINETPDIAQSPDKVPTPPPDATGHIYSVEAFAHGQTINSDPEVEVRRTMAALIANAPAVPTPNTEKKLAQSSQID